MAASSESWEVAAEQNLDADYRSFLSGVEVWIQRPHVVNRRLLGAAVMRDPLKWSRREQQLVMDLKEREEGDTCYVRELLPKTMAVPNAREVILISSRTCEVLFHPVSDTLGGSSGAYKLRYSHGHPYSCVTLLIQRMSGHGASPAPVGIGTTLPKREWLVMVLFPKLCKWMKEEAEGELKGGSHLDQPQGRRRELEELVPVGRYCQLYKELKKKYGPHLVKNWPESTDPRKFVYEDIAIATFLLVLWEGERHRMGEEKKQTFIDLGCGNGLLVYILSSEGHPGKGLDLRSRKIWHLLRIVADLEVCSLVPSGKTRFPDTDWLIGNHSDELTPWIPVMAARSSFSTRYFILPCCAHDFDRKFCRSTSSKSQYQSYLEYTRNIGENMGFLVREDSLRIPSSKRVCQVGLCRTYPQCQEAIVEERRTAFISSRCLRKSPPDKQIMSEDRHSLLDMEDKLTSDDGASADKCCSWSHTPAPTDDGSSCSQISSLLATDIERGAVGKSVWSHSFKPRAVEEVTRNCAHVKESVKSEVASSIFSLLLALPPRWVSVPFQCQAHPQTTPVLGTGNGMRQAVGVEYGDICRDVICTCAETIRWNKGGKIPLEEAAKVLDHGTLSALRKEYGGLQTLLRNHCQTFTVRGGYVEIRDWYNLSATREHQKKSRSWKRKEEDSKLLTKTKLCWFYDHHPQGCPRHTHHCPYAHGTAELRQRPDFKTLDRNDALRKE